MLREKMLFSGEIYTTGKNLTLPPAVTAGTNITSVCLGRSLSDNTFNNIKGCGCYGYYGSNKGRGSGRHGWIGGKVNHIAEELKLFFLGDQFFLGNKCKRSLNQGMLDAKISLQPAKLVIQLLVLVFNKLIKDGCVCVCEDLEVVCQLLVEPSTNQPTTKSDSRDQLHQSFISSTLPKLQTISLVEGATLHTPKLKLLLLEKNVAGRYFARDNGFPL